jgi:peroxiredoxin
MTYSEKGALGDPAPDFRLAGVDGKEYTLASFKDARALVVAFICNHCPYVIAVRGRINALARELEGKGVRLVAINSNDAVAYPDDNLDSMKKVAREQGYVFPYLFDETQSVAHAYGAVCTPDFYLFDGARKLRYRGRLDDSWREEKAVKKRDLLAATEALLVGQSPAVEQFPSMGCSLKWK